MNARDPETAFREWLYDRYKYGQIDFGEFTYFVRPLRERPTFPLLRRTLSEKAQSLRILDIGSGMGSLEIEMSRTKRLEMIGVELNGFYVKSAQMRSKLHKSDAAFLRSDIRRLPLRKQSFDIVVVHDVLTTLPLGQFVQEITRILKHRGKLVFDAPMKAFYDLIRTKKTFLQYYMRNITDDLAKGNLVVEKVLLMNLPPYVYQKLHLADELANLLGGILVSLPQAVQRWVGGFWYLLFFVCVRPET